MNNGDVDDDDFGRDEEDDRVASLPRSFHGDFFPSRITESSSSGYSSSSIESHLLHLSSADSADEASPSPASSRSNSGLERLEETVLAESEESSSNPGGLSSPEEEEPVSWDQYSSLIERSRVCLIE